MTYLANVPRIPPEGRSAGLFRKLDDLERLRRAQLRAERIASFTLGAILGAMLMLMLAVAIAPESVARAAGLL